MNTFFYLCININKLFLITNKKYVYKSCNIYLEIVAGLFNFSRSTFLIKYYYIFLSFNFKKCTSYVWLTSNTTWSYFHTFSARIVKFRFTTYSKIYLFVCLNHIDLNKFVWNVLLNGYYEKISDKLSQKLLCPYSLLGCTFKETLSGLIFILIHSFDRNFIMFKPNIFQRLLINKKIILKNTILITIFFFFRIIGKEVRNC